jgi:hypothetical protein
MWGLESIGPSRIARGGYKHILVVVDKFTKWIDVKPMCSVISSEVAKFVEDITHHFDVPNRIITDLRLAFTCSQFLCFSRTT